MGYQLHLGDCLDVMAGMEPNSVDSIITDPPYGLEFMGKEWDSFKIRQDGWQGIITAEARGENDLFTQKGFKSLPEFRSLKASAMPAYQEWCIKWASAMLRVAKPGAILMAFGGTRTFHRLACAIEDAGWEIRDTMMWVYGSGFPKSHDISKGIDKAAGAEREVVGRKEREGGWHHEHTINDDGWTGSPQGITSPATALAAQWDGWGTALKPAWEPIIIAMKPLDGTFAQNAEKWGVAGYWIDGGRVKGDRGSGVWGSSNKTCQDGRTFNASPNGEEYVSAAHELGRWPANLIHDGSAEVTGLFPNDAARFFYCAKASKSERDAGLDGDEKPIVFWQTANGTSGKPSSISEGRNTAYRNHHPTVKPLALMRYLCRLTKTPTGGVVLDPFMGSGTTGCAAIMEGRDFIGIEKEPEYMAIAEKRIANAAMQVPLL